jgi:hypothetical protein
MTIYPLRQTHSHFKNAYRNEGQIGESQFHLEIEDAAIKGLAIFKEERNVKMQDESASNVGNAARPGGPSTLRTAAFGGVTDQNGHKYGDFECVERQNSICFE